MEAPKCMVGRISTNVKINDADTDTDTDTDYDDDKDGGVVAIEFKMITVESNVD